MRRLAMTHPSEPENITEPAQLRFLHRLVTTLTVIMVGEFLVVVRCPSSFVDDTSAGFRQTLPCPMARQRGP